MQRKNRIIILVSFLALLLAVSFAPYPGGHGRTLAQNAANVELDCPAGFTPLNNGQTVDNITGKWRRWLCVDVFGNVNLQLQNVSIVTNPNGGSGGGTGGTGGTGGGGSVGQVLSGNTFPGMVLAGPIPTANGLPATLENSAQNIGTPTAVSLTAAPLAASATTTATAIYTEIHSDGSHASAPDGTWTTLDASTLGNGAVFYKPGLTDTSPISISKTVGGGVNWSNSLFFVGGSVSSIPHSVTLTSGGACTGINWCFTGALGPVTANNAILVIATSGSTSNNPGVSVGVSDSDGDTFSQVANVFNTSNQAEHYAFLATNVAAGTPAIKVTSNIAFAFNWLSVRAYELAGTAAYYSGAQGPFGFRYLTPQDFGPNLFPTGVNVFANNALSGNVTVTTTATTIATNAITMPASGCPCRVFISYSGWLNFAGVTNEPDQDFWVSDGTVTMAGTVTGQSNASTGATTAVSYAGFSPVLYANNQAVTFTWIGIDSAVNAGTQTFVVTAAPPTGSGPHTTFQVAVLTSK